MCILGIEMEMEIFRGIRLVVFGVRSGGFGYDLEWYGIYWVFIFEF